MAEPLTILAITTAKPGWPGLCAQLRSSLSPRR
jgi:hypothetical protein